MRSAQIQNLGFKGLTFSGLWAMNGPQLKNLGIAKLRAIQHGLESRAEALQRQELSPKELFLALADNRVAQKWIGRLMREKEGRKLAPLLDEAGYP